MMKLKLINRSIYILTFVAVLVFSNLNAEVQYEEVLKAEEFPVGNMLIWTTAFEDNSQHFFVERSFDGNSFQNIGKIEAAGFSEEGEKYRFLDVGVQSEEAFYRLKQTDIDGTISFSHIVAMRKIIKNDFMVVRMNGTDIATKFECSIDNLTPGIMNYEVQNLKGEALISEEISLIAGLNDVIIDMESLEQGIYKVKLLMNNEEEILVIQRVMNGESPLLRADKGDVKKGG